jgi:hypothetical protein
MIKKYFDHSLEFVSNIEIYDIVCKLGYKGNSHALGRLLAAEGFQRGKIKNQRGYFIAYTGCKDPIEADDKPKKTVNKKCGIWCKKCIAAVDKLPVNISGSNYNRNKIRRNFKNIDSYFISSRTGIDPEICLLWKIGRYDLTNEQLDLIIKNFS